MRGPRHGGHTAESRACWTSRASPNGVRRAMAARLRRGESIPGFGHPLYPDGDPRARAILAAVERSSRHRRPPPSCAPAGAPAGTSSAIIPIWTLVSSSCAGRSACREDRRWCCSHWAELPDGWPTRWNSTRSISSSGRGPPTRDHRHETAFRRRGAEGASRIRCIDRRIKIDGRPSRRHKSLRGPEGQPRRHKDTKANSHGSISVPFVVNQSAQGRGPYVQYANGFGRCCRRRNRTERRRRRSRSADRSGYEIEDLVGQVTFRRRVRVVVVGPPA